MSKQQKPVHNHLLSLPEAYVANIQIATSLVRTAICNSLPFCRRTRRDDEEGVH